MFRLLARCLISEFLFLKLIEACLGARGALNPRSPSLFSDPLLHLLFSLPQGRVHVDAALHGGQARGMRELEPSTDTYLVSKLSQLVS